MFLLVLCMFASVGCENDVEGNVDTPKRVKADGNITATVTSINLSSNFSLIQPNGSTVALTPDNAIQFTQLVIATDGSGVITLAGGSVSAVLGIASGNAQNIDGVSIYSANRSAVIGTIHLLEKGLPTETTSLSGSSCPTSDNKPGMTEQYSVVLATSDWYEIDLAHRTQDAIYFAVTNSTNLPSIREKCSAN
jgi:hypothetical protein